MKMKDAHKVPHGWRATFSSIMNERFPADRAMTSAPATTSTRSTKPLTNTSRKAQVAGTESSFIR